MKPEIKRYCQKLMCPSVKARKALKMLGIKIDECCIVECETYGCKSYLIFKTLNQQRIMKELAGLGWNIKYNGKENKMYTYYCLVCTEKEINVKKRISFQKET